MPNSLNLDEFCGFWNSLGSNSVLVDGKVVSIWCWREFWTDNVLSKIARWKVFIKKFIWSLHEREAIAFRFFETPGCAFFHCNTISGELPHFISAHGSSVGDLYVRLEILGLLLDRINGNWFQGICEDFNNKWTHVRNNKNYKKTKFWCSKI